MNRFPSPSRRVMGLLIAAPFVAAACTGAAAETATDPAAAVPAEPSPVVTAGAGASTAGEETAAWLDVELTDATSGETFTLASLSGEIVAVEPMAIWCSNCKAQQDNVKTAYDQIAGKGVRYISLGIDPGENPEALAKYADRRGYPWTFVQSPKELSRALSDAFGPQILSAPSTPLIVLDETGEVVFRDFGFHGPEKLVSIFEEATA